MRKWQKGENIQIKLLTFKVVSLKNRVCNADLKLLPFYSEYLKGNNSKASAANLYNNNKCKADIGYCGG